MFKSDEAELYPQMTQPPALRAAIEGDAADLAVLADMATRRLTSHLWGLAAQPGQSAFELGRRIIHSDTGHFSHFRNWRVAEVGGAIAGALCGGILSAPPTPSAVGAEVVGPLNALKGVAAGTWYLSALALYPEQQRKGLGRAMLAEAEAMARAAGADCITLMVGSFNTGARALYQQVGYAEWDRRAFLQFPGSDAEGDWILMRKDLR
jgi:ribosomal protein S18 acetylase RimI-like enzyme